MPSSAEWRKLAPWVVLMLICAAAGAALIWYAQRILVQERQALTAAQSERAQSREKLSRISEEEREVREKSEVYRRLKSLGIIGPERRLEWADTMSRIRTARELLDLRYRVAPRRPLVSVPGKPANVEFYASQMTIELAMLHEGDLLRLLTDLRESGNAYYAVNDCSLARNNVGQAAGLSMTPRLTASCNIDLITIIDPGAKS